MQSQHARIKTRAHVFTASEVAEFEYCPLAWWHEQFEDWARAESEELFARLVELEHEHGAQAPALPEYRLIEQLLLRQGAFERGHQQHEEHAGAVADIEEEIEEDRRPTGRSSLRGRALLIAILALCGLALLLLIFSQVWH
ncbi:MAG TPA: hypothetical protein VF458_10515 [Ktedonobacteraceae bacterium]